MLRSLGHGQMISLALLGKNISHSLSPKLYREIYGADNVKYKLLDFQTDTMIPSLEVIFREVDGLNITSPYKQHFLKDVEILNPALAHLDAINCIGRMGQKFVATNTDFTALKRLLPALKINKEILILGSGVMAKLVEAVCIENNYSFATWSRKNSPHLFSQMDFNNLPDKNVLVVNCCAREFAFRGQLPPTALFWDLNYLHSEHEMIFARDERYIDGLNLLRAQAVDAAAFWSQLKN